MLNFAGIPLGAALAPQTPLGGQSALNAGGGSSSAFAGQPTWSSPSAVGNAGAPNTLALTQGSPSNVAPSPQNSPDWSHIIDFLMQKLGISMGNQGGQSGGLFANLGQGGLGSLFGSGGLYSR